MLTSQVFPRWKVEYVNHFQKCFQIHSVVFYRLLFLVYIFKLLFYFLKYSKHTYFLHLLIPICQIFLCLTQHFLSICSYLCRLAFFCVLCFLIVSFCSWNFICIVWGLGSRYYFREALCLLLPVVWRTPNLNSRWVIIPSWLSGSWRSFLYISSVYSCHLFPICALIYDICFSLSDLLHSI